MLMVAEMQPSRVSLAAAMPVRAGRTRAALRNFILQVFGLVEEKIGSMCSKRVTWVQTNGSGVNQECNQTKAE
jgi:hypothetical protein